MKWLRYGYIEYTEEDIVGKCPVCGFHIIKRLTMGVTAKLPENTMNKLRTGEYIIGWCPKCNYTAIWPTI